MNMVFPKAIYIETTNLCNARCIMCPHKYLKRSQGYMQESIFRRVVNELKDIGVKGTQIFFHKEGEPLLDKYITPKIAYAKKEIGTGNEYGMNTNAMLLTKEKAADLIASGLDTIYFSLDGVEKRNYESVRVNLDFDIVVNNIKNFFDVRERSNSHIKVIMQMLVRDDDSPEAEVFKKQWSDYPCEFYIKRMHSYLDGGCSTLTKDLEIRQKRICEDPFKIMVIFIDGSVGLCCWDYNNEYSLGNVKNNTLMALFNNNKARYLREKMIALDCDGIEPCNRCYRIYGNDYISGY